MESVQQEAAVGRLALRAATTFRPVQRFMVLKLIFPSQTCKALWTAALAALALVFRSHVQPFPRSAPTRRQAWIGTAPFVAVLAGRRVQCFFMERAGSPMARSS